MGLANSFLFLLRLTGIAELENGGREISLGEERRSAIL